MELAIRRILLIHGIILTVGGIPLLYLGDEIGTLNDYAYRDDPHKAADSRWVHRPRADWEKYARRTDPASVEGRVYQGLQALIALRKEHAAFFGGELTVIDTENPHVLGFERMRSGQRAVILANFSETEQVLFAGFLARHHLTAGQIAFQLGHFNAQPVASLAPLSLVVFIPS